MTVMPEIYHNIPPDMQKYGGRVEWGVAEPDSPFYDLAGCTVRIGVNAVCECVFYGVNNLPVSGLTVVNVRADGRGEIQQTDASGRVAFMFGTGSAFTPSDGTPPPLKIFAVDAAAKDDESKLVVWGKRISDAVLVGDTGGLHTEWSIPFTLHPPVVIVPPVVPPADDVPTLANDDELRIFCGRRGFKAFDYNPDAAFTKCAQLNGWGVPMSDEFRYRNSAGVLMAGQAFAGNRIATCVDGDWENVIGVRW